MIFRKTCLAPGYTFHRKGVRSKVAQNWVFQFKSHRFQSISCNPPEISGQTLPSLTEEQSTTLWNLRWVVHHTFPNCIIHYSLQLLGFLRFEPVLLGIVSVLGTALGGGWLGWPGWGNTPGLLQRTWRLAPWLKLMDSYCHFFEDKGPRPFGFNHPGKSFPRNLKGAKGFSSQLHRCWLHL